jgi:8-oxo-dGTP pyrophosphatase MutT (NUDIX family)
VHAVGVWEPVAAKPAATVVVLRSAAPPAATAFEVMLLRRSAAMSFVAGAHVFPGGRIDAGDLLADPEACCDGLGGAPRFPDLDADGELAARVAAVRELVEEAGVLLARRDGAWATTEEAEEVRRLSAEGPTFEHVIREGGWRIALDALVPFARIVTPSSEPRRFDTHFFVAELPAGRQACAHEAESDELIWLTPGNAMDGGRTGAVVLLPPTWMTLMQLAAFESAAELVASARRRRIERVEPVLTHEAGTPQITFPASLLPAAAHDASASPPRFSPAKGGGWRPVLAAPPA